MATTKQLPPGEWKSYFERFARKYLNQGAPELAAVEIVSPTLGDQIEASGSRLRGLTYDPKSRAFEVWLEGVDHLVFQPAEMWVIEEEGGFISALELVRADSSKEIICVRRAPN